MNEEEKHICVYCGAEATHQFKNGKWCCSKNQAACPAIKRRSGIALSNRHKEAEEKFGNKCFQKGASIVQRQKSHCEDEHVCAYCGAYAEYKLKNGKWCCKPSGNSCPVRRRQAANNVSKRDYKKWYANLPEETKKRMFKRCHSKEAQIKRQNTIRKRYASGELIGSFTGRKHTQDEIDRIRETVTKYRIEHGIWSMPRVSPVACAYIDKLNESRGWHLQHGMNGGEVSVGGYYLDGYDKELNIAFEYDEPAHYVDIEHNVLRERDIKRMAFIKEKLGCRFFRFNEKTNTLYEC